MYYKVFPYDLGESKITGFQIDDCINILSGSFDLKQLNENGSKISQQRFTNEKIVAASLLQRPQVEGVQIMVVI